MKLCLNIILFLFLIVVVGCNSDDTINNLPPRDFETKAISARINDITIAWNESTDPENSIIKYEIYLAENISGAEFVKIGPNFEEEEILSLFPLSQEFKYSYKVEKINHNTNWKGKVVAIDEDGQKKVSFFWTTTQEDNVVPVINDITVWSRKFYARFGVDI